MITNVNTNSISQFIEKKKSTDQPDETSLGKQILISTDLIERLFKQVLLPQMINTDQPIIKVSRRNYDFLENSFIATQNGEIFQQHHWNDRIGNKILNVEKKGLVGMGSYKRVWDLKPFPSNITSSSMVRTRFHWDKTNRIYGIEENLKKIKELKKANTRFLLIPESFTYTSSCGFQAIVQMMPKAIGGDLFFASQTNKLSYLGKLHTIHNLGQALTDMHIKNWVHLDVKLSNILLMNLDPNHPVSKLTDFDFARKFKLNEDPSHYFEGTPLYMDPKCLKNEAHGLDDAKIHDQFSFGATSFQLLTGQILRGSFNEEQLKEWVKEEDLISSSSFLQLNECIQNIIKNCCIGPSEIRPYRLDDFLKSLEELIFEEEK